MIKHVLPAEEILARLRRLGYFGDKNWAEVSHLRGQPLEDAVRRFQNFHDLSDDGEVGPFTANLLFRNRCGLPDFEIREDARACKWPMMDVTYGTHTSFQLPGLTTVQVAQAFDQACRQWNDVCGIRLRRLSNAAQANIYARSGTGRSNNLDNRGGTLAWSELPCGATSNNQLDQMYDEAEAWQYNMAVAVICHEIGHALGLSHLKAGSLLAPYFNVNIIKPQAVDIQAIRELYGLPTSPPTPGPTPTPTPTPGGQPDISGVITINGFPYVLQPR